MGIHVPRVLLVWLFANGVETAEQPCVALAGDMLGIHPLTLMLLTTCSSHCLRGHAWPLPRHQVSQMVGYGLGTEESLRPTKPMALQLLSWIGWCALNMGPNGGEGDNCQDIGLPRAVNHVQQSEFSISAWNPMHKAALEMENVVGPAFHDQTEGCEPSGAK